MLKNIHEMNLTVLPPGIEQCFDVLSQAGASEFALFGGAVRDTDYAAYYNVHRTIKDYDLRVWLPPDNHAERIQDFITHLGLVAGTAIREVPAGGTRYMRYCLDFNDTELDVSFRPRKIISVSLASVAIDRAGDADIGLSAVAIASDGSAWATEEYLHDRNNRTLSVYPDLNAGRLADYTARMKQKFPDHTVVSLAG